MKDGEELSRWDGESILVEGRRVVYGELDEFIGSKLGECNVIWVGRG